MRRWPAPRQWASHVAHGGRALPSGPTRRGSVGAAAAREASTAITQDTADAEEIASAQRAPLGEAHTIQGDTHRLSDLVAATCPRWPPQLARWAAVGLHCYKKRWTDMSERDFVHLLWIVCGDILLRAHSGVVYVFSPVFGN